VTIAVSGSRCAAWRNDEQIASATDAAGALCEASITER
jgi:hypothetical protein